MQGATGCPTWPRPQLGATGPLQCCPFTGDTLCKVTFKFFRCQLKRAHLHRASLCVVCAHVRMYTRVCRCAISTRVCVHACIWCVHVRVCMGGVQGRTVTRGPYSLQSCSSSLAFLSLSSLAPNPRVTLSLCQAPQCCSQDGHWV